MLDAGTFPETRWVKGSNYCDIGFAVDERTGRLTAVGAIDNLVKGASGQAVQNMNIMFGFPENEGLDIVPGFPM
jgi:N-acetyl-gamma-glutamyl-phosphate reductase